MSRKKILVLIGVLVCTFIMSISERYIIEVMADEGDYMIKVNAAKNCITIYEKGSTGEYTVPVKSMACSVFEGIEGETEYSVMSKTEWKRMADRTYSHYVLQIDRNIHICTSPFTAQANDTLDKDKFNVIGEGTSAQNIWVNSADAKWLYENCANGAIVQIYRNDESEGPLGKPDTIKLNDTSLYPNWDPTDDNENNPWLSHSAKIEGVRDLEIMQSEEINLLADIKGYDICGNDISDKIIIMGTYDFKKEGQYLITYYLKDATGSQVNQTANLFVRKNEQETDNGNGEIESVSDNNVLDKGEKSRGDKIDALIGIGIVAFGIAAIIIKRSNSI